MVNQKYVETLNAERRLGTAPPVLRLPRNYIGRDFVVGDIHGAYDLVIEGMEKVSFDVSRDRLFSVGDLVDRGVGSARCREFLAKPYVFAVRGNHDDDLLQVSHEVAQLLARVNYNGMAWLSGIEANGFSEIQAAFAQLPVVIEVDTARGLVGMVHGDVPAGMCWQDFVAAVKRGDEQTIECALNGRDRMLGGHAAGVEGVGRVYVGHCVNWEGPRQLGNVIGIDTGAVFREVFGDGRGALSLVRLECVTSALNVAPPRPSPGVDLFVDVCSSPFGRFDETARSA